LERTVYRLSVSEYVERYLRVKKLSCLRDGFIKL